MPSVPAVSSGEILDVVVMPPSSRGDSGSGRGRFEDVLAGASQDKGSDGVLPQASAQPSKSRESQNDVAPAKPKSPEESGSQRENASADASTSKEKKPAPASASEGKSEAPAKKKKVDEEQAKPVSADENEEEAEEKAVEVISQLIAAGVNGLTQAVGQAPGKAASEEGQAVAASNAVSVAKQGQNAVVQTIVDGRTALPQDGTAEDGQAVASQAEQEGAEPAAQVLAGALLTEDTEEAAPAPVLTDAVEEAPETASKAVVAEGEDSSGTTDEDAVQASAVTVLDEGAPAEEAAAAGGARPNFTDLDPEEITEEASTRAAAPAPSADEDADGVPKVDWTRWIDTDGTDGADASSKGSAAAAAGMTDGEFAALGQGDDSDGGPLGRTAAIQAAADARARDAGPAGPVSQPVDAFLRAEVHRQVMEAALSRMSIAVRNGVAQARIHLDPPSLGRMHMDIRMQNGAMHAKVTVETGWARDAVMSGLRDLRESLLRHGVSLENFSVDVRANLNAGSFGQDRAANPDGNGALYLEAVPDEESGSFASDGSSSFISSSGSGDRSINIFA